MLKAYQLHPVRDLAGTSFVPPPGVEMVSIDNEFEEAFIVGTAPKVAKGFLPPIAPITQIN